MIYLILLLILFGGILIYFRLADRFNIIDKPNDRSSHIEITIRGGGIVYVLALILLLILDVRYMVPVTGGLLIGVISFLDDIYTLSSKLRILVHVMAVTLLFSAISIFSFPVYICITLYITVIGVINMYNFMDGINGITGLYTLIVLLGLQYINLRLISFIQPDAIWLPIMASVVFLIFNFRKKAKCFAGDVGSVTIAFWIVFLLFKLIIQTNDFKYILFLSVYVVDAGLTIIHRLILKQNIFEAHRLHFYQLLANEYKVPHLVVSAAYALVQAVIIACIIANSSGKLALLLAIAVVPLVLVYVVFKPRLMKFNLMKK